MQTAHGRAQHFCLGLDQRTVLDASLINQTIEHSGLDNARIGVLRELHVGDSEKNPQTCAHHALASPCRPAF